MQRLAQPPPDWPRAIDRCRTVKGCQAITVMAETHAQHPLGLGDQSCPRSPEAPGLVGHQCQELRTRPAKHQPSNEAIPGLPKGIVTLCARVSATPRLPWQED